MGGGDEHLPSAGAQPAPDAERTPARQPASTTAAPAAAPRQAARGAPTGPTLMQRIKDKQPLLEYIQRFRQMKKGAGDEWYGNCISPDHEDDSPSFYVNTKLQCFSCRGCGVSGNIVSAHALLNNMSDEDAKFDLGRLLGVMHDRRLDDAESMLSRAAGRYVWQLERKQDALEYLRTERGLTDETIARFGLGFCWGTEFKDATPEQVKLGVDTGLVRVRENDRSVRSFMAGRITFPVKDRTGRVVGFAGRLVPRPDCNSNGPKYLNTPETAWFHKSELLFGAYEANSGISRKGFAVVVEGYMDVVALHQCGVNNAVAVMGASANEVTFQSLWDMTKRVVFCLDGDKAGDEGTLRSVLAAAPTMEDGAEIAVVHLPSGVDPDEFVLEHGEAAFSALCDRATPLARYLMEARSGDHDLSYPEGRARFMADANEVAGIFAKAPIVREQIVAEARAINAASLVKVALDITGVAENVSARELRDAIALMQRRLDAIKSATPSAAAAVPATRAPQVPAAEAPLQAQPRAHRPR